LPGRLFVSGARNIVGRAATRACSRFLAALCNSSKHGSHNATAHGVHTHCVGASPQRWHSSCADWPVGCAAESTGRGSSADRRAWARLFKASVRRESRHSLSPAPQAVVLINKVSSKFYSESSRNINARHCDIRALIGEEVHTETYTYAYTKNNEYKA
jgi:hypothetical protein